MIKNTSFPNNESYNDIKRYMYSPSYYNSPKKNHLKKDIQKFRSKYKPLFSYKLSKKTFEFNLHKEELEYEQLIGVEDTPLKRIRENRTTKQFAEEIEKESVREADSLRFSRTRIN